MNIPLSSQPNPDNAQTTSVQAGTPHRIRILQWNANGILRELHLLENLLQEKDVDVACIQETKLIPPDEMPELQHYTALRKDRENPGEARGGGLLMLIKRSIPYNPIGSEPNLPEGLESQRVEIPLLEEEPLRITNAYLPPQNSPYLHRMGFEEREIQMEVSIKDVICADLNAHDPLWDTRANPTGRGQLLSETILDTNAAVLNTDCFTRQDPATGTLSSPDLTIVHETVADQCTWQPLDRLSSDHRPLLITLDLQSMQTMGSKRLVWDWKSGDLQAFTRALDDKVTGWEEDCQQKVAPLTKSLCDAILTTAYAHIGLKAVGTRGEVWRTREITDAEALRDRIREEQGINSAQFQELNAKLKELTTQNKKSIWQRKVINAKGQKDMWRILRSLTTPKRSDPNRALESNGRLCLTPQKKANAFLRHYQSAGAITISKEDRALKRKLNVALRQPQPPRAATGEISEAEVHAAIKQIDPSKSPGPDGIHPRFLHLLGPQALRMLTRIYQLSWSKREVPQDWRKADIRPILKAGKNPAKLESYRPISLTSVIGKGMERVITNRLRFMLEDGGLLSEDQAGFRSFRSTEDQLLRLSQTVSNGFQKSPMERTVLTLVDFSRAYDTVWRDALLLKMTELGIPVSLVSRVQAWLANRLNWVTYDGSKSDRRSFKQGVPQGSVISPLLFLIYINDLPEAVEDVQVSMFADDVAVWAQDRELGKAQQKVQTAIDRIDEWSNKWKLTISTGKTECSFFTTNTHEACWEPSLTLRGEPITVNPYPKFLGVTYDRQLSFARHSHIVGNQLRQQAGALRRLANTEWGYDKATLRSTYITVGRSRVEYAAPAWLPWLSATGVEKVEANQRYAGRAITGQLRTTPTEAILVEANLPSIETRATQLGLIAYEKSQRLDPANPRHDLVENSVRQRTTKPSWRQKAAGAWASIFGNTKPEAFPKPLPPWLDVGTPTFELGGLKSLDPTINRQQALESLVRNWDKYEVTVYTDGSATDGTRNGGGGIVVTTGPPEHPVVEEIISLPAGEWSSSYQAEFKAMLRALQHINTRRVKTARLVSDSKAVLTRLQAIHPSAKLESEDERQTLLTLHELHSGGCSLTFTWCPSHCGIEGNEMADEAAKEGSTADQTGCCWFYSSAKAAIRRLTRTRPISHPRIRAVYGERGEKVDRKAEEALTRAEQVTLSRLRSGHHPELKYWQHKIGRATDVTCRKCGIGEETAEHALFLCPRLEPLHGSVSSRTLLERWEKWLALSVRPDVSGLGSPRL